MAPPTSPLEGRLTWTRTLPNLTGTAGCSAQNAQCQLLDTKNGPGARLSIPSPISAAPFSRLQAEDTNLGAGARSFSFHGDNRRAETHPLFFASPPCPPASMITWHSGMKPGCIHCLSSNVFPNLFSQPPISHHALRASEAFPSHQRTKSRLRKHDIEMNWDESSLDEPFVKVNEQETLTKPKGISKQPMHLQLLMRILMQCAKCVKRKQRGACAALEETPMSLALIPSTSVILRCQGQLFRQAEGL